MEQLAWIESTAFSIWTRESSWALFAFLILHTAGMGFLLGTSAAANLRILGFASRIPLPSLPRLMPVIYAALAVAAGSGVLLLVAYPAKALTTPLFYVKLTVIAAAFVLTRRLILQLSVHQAAIPRWAKAAAVFALLLWAGGLTAGKFLEYTYTILNAP